MSAITHPENLHFKLNLAVIIKGYVSSVLIYWSVYQYLLNEYLNKGKERLMNILKISGYLILLPLFFTVFGGSLGFTEQMSYVKDFGDRQIGIFSNPNTTGLHSNFVLGFAFYFLISNKGNKLFWLCIALGSVYGAYLSLSKAAMLTAGLNLIFFVFFNIFYFAKLKLSGKFIGIVSVGLIFFTSFYIYTNFDKILGELTYSQAVRIKDTLSLLQGEVNNQTTSDRSEVAEKALPLIKENFLFGNGLGSFHRLIVCGGLGVHNTALLIIGESGLIPSFLFLLFIGLYFYNALKQKELASKYLYFSIMITFLFIAFLTGHNGLEERISNVLLALIISFMLIKDKLNIKSF